MAKRYLVDLTPEERATLQALIRRGKASARKVRRAHLLLLADEGQTDAAIAAALHAGVATVERIRKRFVEEGLAAALAERPRPGARPKLAGNQEAFLVALACSSPPEGRKAWTLQLLADQMVTLGVVESLSADTVGRLLKRGRSSPGLRRPGASPR